MALFEGENNQADGVIAPTPFIAEVLRRIGEQYGGWDVLVLLSAGSGGPGMELTIHIDGVPAPGRAEFMHGTGIIRTVRVFGDHAEVFDEGRMIAHFDDPPAPMCSVRGTRAEAAVEATTGWWQAFETA